jgi:alpha-methylacyl-CoA racemase
MGGALQGVRVIEFTGLGPAPFCGMMLADQGAEVIRIDRAGGYADPHDALARSRRSILVDMKVPEGLALVHELCATADALIEGYRPGVMERLGLGPAELLAANPKLVYGRMTGWGQDGPLAHAAGHDINYIGITGALHTVGAAGGKPIPPANYVGDFGGGGMLLAFGIAAALVHVRSGGQGQVIDAAMVDGASLLAGMVWSQYNVGRWRDHRGDNWIDGGAHHYDTYECADGRFIAVGAIEPQFYALMRDAFGFAGDPDFDGHMERRNWPENKRKIAAVVKTRTREEWCAALEGTDACVSPVLSLAEVPEHPHIRARATLVEVNGKLQPAPAPRFSATPADKPRPASTPGTDGAALLSELGYTPERIAALRAAGALGG